MSEQTLAQPRTGLGAIVYDGGVAFRVWAPFAEAVSVVGSFNDWSPDANKMNRDENGYWYAEVGGATVGQEYKFIIKNGEKVVEKNDPRARQVTAAGDASIIVSPDFDWGDTEFKLAPQNQQVIYELHVGTFNRTDPATPGTFQTAAQKLDYLADLGVNVIELMPVNGTNVDRWWGYDCNNLFAIEAEYGGHQAFLEFVKAAHEKGIGVIVDVVYNHLSPFPGLDLWQFDGWNENEKGGIYFYNDWRGDTPWGPRLDYGRPEVRQYITDNVRMWLQECRVDGLRVDAVFQIRNALGHNDEPSTDIPDGWRVMQEMTAAAEEINPNAMTVGEDMAVNDYITKPRDEGGAGFKAQWETTFPFALRNVLNPINDNDRQLIPLRDELAKKYNNDAFQRVIYSESHDADANGHARMNEEIAPGKSDDLFARRRTALAAVMVFTSPGIPMLFQGQELMESGWFSQWKALDWSKADKNHGMVQLYRDLIALRLNKRNCCGGLLGHGFNTLNLDEAAKVLVYHRWDKGGSGDDVVVALNLSNEAWKDHPVNFPVKGTWKVRLNSDWQGYSPDFGNMPTPDISVEKDFGTVNLAPYSALILSQD